MSIFDAFMSEEALAKKRQAEERSASDIKYEQRAVLQNELAANPALFSHFWPREDEALNASINTEAYAKTYNAAMAQPHKEKSSTDRMIARKQAEADMIKNFLKT